MTSRKIHLAAAVLLGVQAIAVGLLDAVDSHRSLLPVSAAFVEGTTLTSVDLGAATVVLLVFSALCQAAAARWSTPVIRWIEWSQISAIVLFLIAQLNGIEDVAALVALYAITAGASLFLVLHERAAESTWPFCFGAAVAIVPWGIVALYQVGSIVVGAEPSVIVPVLTLAMLALAACYWFFARVSRKRSSLVIAERAHTTIVVLTVSILAWTVTLAG